MASLTTIGFDADDTLWQNEQFFRMTEARFAELLADFAEADHLTERLIEAEKRNLARYGFGIKGFVLSMIETALEVTDNRVPGAVIGEPDALEGQSADTLHRIVGFQAIRRPQSQRDLLGTLVFLLSEDSDFMTGQTVAVDGGSINT